MSKEQYLNLQKFFSTHHSLQVLADFFAAQIVYAYVVLPFILVWFPSGRKFIVMAGAALIVGWGILVQLIAYLFPSPRPYQKFGFTPGAGRALFSRIDKRLDAFPSGHTTALATLTLVIAFFSTPAAFVSGGVLLLTAAARVVLGYHYPKDILGGVVIAGLIVWGINFIGVFDRISTFVE